ncbi:MAG TPA: Hpt domain-containing protein, partial [Steroidobacteraceae bacterium]|nr:Hpt domain-containing protein [Steroidobacteraceae bacterium]
MTDISSQTLHIVAKELTATLNEARAALEAYAERSDQNVFLEKCADQLHLAHGVLRLVEVYGAALLAEEMEHVTRYILAAGSDQKRQVEGLDALMRSMVQLPTYLERVLSGGRDLALVLLPLLNDLRSVRGSPLLSEGTLLLLNLKSDQPAQPQPQQGGEPAITVAQWARRLRPRFQIGLLGYIRGERTVQNLEILAKVAEKLEQVATTQPVFQLWWVVGALLEAVRANGIEGSATLKRLLGQADRQIKLLYEVGEARYCESPPVDLLNNLLYYIARASAGGGRIAAVRASFKLAELLPVDDTIEQERESLSAPSVKLMRTVAAAIKEDLSKVKDVFDIFVRRGGGRSDELIPQLELLKKISDTLGVLGLGELRQRVHQEVAELSEIVTDGKTPSELALIKVAGVLLSVEDSLDDQLVRLILPTESLAADIPVDQDHEFRQVSEAVLRECIVNLARIKEAVSLSVQKPAEFAPQGLDNVPQLLRGITAGLLMLGKGRAVELMDAVGTEVRRLIEPGAPAADALRLERVADAIVSIEYYMETLQNGRTDPWYMLDNAETCIKALTEETLSRVPNLDLPDSDGAKTVKLDAAATIALEPLKNGQALTHAQLSTHPLFSPAEPEGVDPQFVELFIEEAKEEIASIQQYFPMWDQNPMDFESLGVLRRSFHTLKGSGRMVGARPIAEFGWAIENLLNRIIDKTLTRTPGMMLLLRGAVAALPQLVEQLESGRSPTAPIGDLMARAFAFSEGRDGELAAGGATSNIFTTTGISTTSISITGMAGAGAAAAPTDVPGVAKPGVATPDAAAASAAPEYCAPVPTQAPAAASQEPASPIPSGEHLSAATGDADGGGARQTGTAAQRMISPDDGPGMDPLLHDIYSKETSSHLAEIREYLEKRSGQSAPHPLPESVYRAIHTLSGSSKMAEARHGIRITEPLNQVMRKIYDSGHGLTETGIATLADAVRAIEEVVSHINESTAFFTNQTALLERLHEMENAIDAELSRASVDSGASAIVRRPAGLPAADEPMAGQAAAVEPIAAHTEDLAGEPSAAEVRNAADEPLAAEAATGVPHVTEAAPAAEAVIPSPRPVEAAPAAEPMIGSPRLAGAAPAAEAHQAAQPVVEEFDHEIAKIYSEEAAELLESAEASLTAWNRDRNDKNPVAELQRQLHTLKGGARMAGITAMGDLSHELESLVLQIDSGTVRADDHAHAVMQASVDELARMRDVVSAGALPTAATALLAQIRGLILGVAQAEPVPPQSAAPYAAAPGVIAPAAAPPPHAVAPVAGGAPAMGGSTPAVAAPGTPAKAAPSEVLPFTAAPPAAGEDSIPNLEISSAPVLPGRAAIPAERVEMARVDADLLDTMLNNAGEVSIFRARLDQQVNSIDFNLAELARTVIRLKDQLRGLEIETEAQVLHRHHDDDSHRSDFDPLELDRYSALQQFSRALAETSGDVASIQGLLETLTREAQNLLTQQSRVITELQNSLMRTRMVPFQRHVQRLTRLVRQAANDTGKRAELVVQGASAELDRQMLERMVAPLEHMLRNSVVHGIETPERRAALRKPDVGRISVSLTRDGAEVVIVVTDDGGGINVKLIREKAAALGLIDRHAKLTDEEAMQLILEPGFSTAGHLTQAAGRGVGMDVVATEVKKLGGGLFIESTAGK